MKSFTNVSRSLLESKLAVGLVAGVFLALEIFLSASPQFAVQGPSGEPLASVHCCHVVLP
jgi:hypothetical protein